MCIRLCTSPRLGGLSQEEIQQLDAITRKLLPPASTAAEDDPQNQIESNTAIIASDVDSQDVESPPALPDAIAQVQEDA